MEYVGDRTEKKECDRELIYKMSESPIVDLGRKLAVIWTEYILHANTARFFLFICLEHFKKCQSSLTRIHKIWQWMHYCSCQRILLFPTFHLAAVMLDGVLLTVGGKELQPWKICFNTQSHWPWSGQSPPTILWEIQLEENTSWKGREPLKERHVRVPLTNNFGGKWITKMLRGTLIIKTGYFVCKIMAHFTQIFLGLHMSQYFTLCFVKYLCVISLAPN